MVFDWLFEGRLSVYILLAIAAVAFLYGWSQLRKRGFFIAAGIGCAGAAAGSKALAAQSSETRAALDGLI